MGHWLPALMNESVTKVIVEQPRLHRVCLYVKNKKSRIRETKHLSTDANSSTHITVGWTKNTQKPNFFEKRKKSSKTQKLKNV